MVTVELNEYEAEVIFELVNESLRLTSIGFENFGMSESDLAAKVATMYTIIYKITQATEGAA